VTSAKFIERIVSGPSQPGTAVVSPDTLNELGIANGDTARLTSLAGEKAIDVKVKSEPGMDKLYILVPNTFVSLNSMVYISAPLIPSSNTSKAPIKSTGSKKESTENKGSGKEQHKPRMVMGKPNLGLSDVAGLSDAKRQIEEQIILPFTNEKLAERYGIRSGGGVLLYGPPGTGKTHIARAVAGEVEGGFFYVTPSEITDKYFGSSEAKISALFEEARSQTKSVIFFDEVESLLPNRGDTSSDAMGRIVPQFLAEMDGMLGDNRNILMLGATNQPWSLDPAVLRPGRFDEQIYIPLPDQEAREFLLKISMKDRPLDKGISFQEISEITEGYSGADIVEICNKSALRPFRDAIASNNLRSISMEDIKEAILSFEPSVDSNMLDKFETYRDRKSDLK